MTQEQIYNRMAALCSRREYCKSDISAKITALSPDADAQALISRLCEERFLDESRYAAAFVRDKSRLQGWGDVKIRFALQRKGLDEETIDEALSQIDTEAQTERLTKLMKSRAQSLEDAAEDEKRAKLIRFAVSRGFSYAQASTICKKIL